MYQLICRLRKSEKGQSLVELALVLPILIILLFGILEFGRVFHSYLVITNAAREGARHGIICRDVTGIKQKVLKSSPGINLEPDDITVNPSTGLTAGVPLTVSVEYHLDILTPVLSGIIPNPVPISATSTMRVE